MINLSLDPGTLAITLEKDGILWQSAPDFEPYIAFGGKNGIYGVSDVAETVRFTDAASIRTETFRTGYGQGVRVSFSGFRGAAEGMAFETLVWQDLTTEEIRCEWVPLSEGKEPVTAVYWPAPMDFACPAGTSLEEAGNWVTLLNEEQGYLLPNDWPTPVSKLGFAGYMGTSGAYMPWFAQIKEGHGLLTICETPWNAAINIDHPAVSADGSDGTSYRTAIGVRFEPSLGLMDYRRVLMMKFVEGDHNDICKAYRAYAFEQGRLVTLKQKALANPSINDMIGCCFVHTGIKTVVQPDSRFYDPENPGKNNHLTPFSEREKLVERLHDLGVEKMYLHLDGWAQPGYDNCHPDYFPICEEAGGEKAMQSLADTMHRLGYMFGIHDQYRDFYHSADSFDEDLACRLTDGTIPGHAMWAGGPQSYLCGSQAPYFVKRNFAKLKAQGIKLDGAYLDVFTCNEGDECTNPRHRMSRRECYEYRQQCFRFLLSQGILPSSEEVNDWAIPSLVFCHYAPYSFQLAEPGSPKKGIPVPLFNLVYHDCVIEPWMMDKATPEEDYFLYALQNGGAPYLIREAAYPNIDGAFAQGGITPEEAVERCKVVQQLHEKVGMEEMISVKLLRKDGTLQQISFADGTSVTVDFTRQTYEIASSSHAVHQKPSISYA